MTDLELAHCLLGLVLYRAGGEQTFTVREVDDIRKVVVGIHIYTGADNRITLRTYGPASLLKGKAL